MRPTLLFLVLAGCGSLTTENAPADASDGVTISDAGGDGSAADDASGPADGHSFPWDQGGYPCGAVTTYPFDGGGFDADDDGGLSYSQCQSLCAGAPGGVRACSLGDGGTTLVCQAPGCG